MELLLATVVVVLLGWGIVVYNRLIADRNRVRAAWSDIDVQLRRRHDLVPRLVEVVKHYAEYERETLERVTALRDDSVRAARVGDIERVESELEGRLHQLVARIEAYPELKADKSFGDLHRNLVDVEDHIQYARRYYNGAVRILNTRIDTFPDLLVARPFRFTSAEFFQVERDDQRAAPSVAASGVVA